MRGPAHAARRRARARDPARTGARRARGTGVRPPGARHRRRRDRRGNRRQLPSPRRTIRTCCTRPDALVDRSPGTPDRRRRTGPTRRSRCRTCARSSASTAPSSSRSPRRRSPRAGRLRLFTLASRLEGLPVALMEALALGLPVVATAVGGIPEAITDGVEGLLVPPGRSDLLGRRDRGARRRPTATSSDGGRVSSPEPRIRRQRAPCTRSNRSTAGSSAGERRSPDRDPPCRRGRHDRRSSPCCGRASGGSTTTATRRSVRVEARGEPVRAVDRVGRQRRRRVSPASGCSCAGSSSHVGALWRAVRAVDTATHPDYQGRGIFTRAHPACARGARS